MDDAVSPREQPPAEVRLDQRQQRIVKRLSTLVGAGAPRFFSDAVALMNDSRSLATVTHLVSHLLRETEGVILDVLAPPERVPKTRKTAQPPPSTAEDAPDEEETAVQHRQRVLRVLERLEIDDSSGPGRTWLERTGRRKKGLHFRAHRSHLDDVHPLDSEFVLFWTEIQSLFDVVLDRYEAKFPELLKEVEGLLAAGASRKRAEHLRSRVPDTPLVRERFFDRAGPEWLPALRAEGLFDQPVVVPDDPLYRWCQSTYLKRMATIPAAHQQVADVLGTLEPLPILRLHMDLLEAARALPPGLSAPWVAKEAAWIDAQSSLTGFYAEELAAFAAALAVADACPVALQLARALLSLRAGRSAPAGFFHLQAAPLFDHYHYARVASALAPVVTHCRGAVIVMGVEILAPALRAARPDESNIEDDSIIWCERISGVGEDDDQVAAMLVALIRDAARASVAADPAALDHVCADLRAGGSAVFRRIELDLLASHEPTPRDRIARVLMERELFTARSTWPEYSVLLRQHWDALDPSQQRTILGWIDEGPPEP